MRSKDYTASVQFLDWLFEHTENPVELRCITDGKSPRANFINAADDIVSFCSRYDQPGSAVYFGSTTRTGGSTKGDRAHCTELPGLWADGDYLKLKVDIDEAISALLSLPCPPSAIVHSGGGLHCWWRLREPLDVSDAGQDEAIIAVLRQLAGVVAGDLKVCDIARVMRLPGTMNSKPDLGEPIECKVLHQDDRTYDFEEIVDWLDWQRPVIVGEIPLKAEITTFSNPFLAAAERFGFKPPLDVQAALEAMEYQAAGENSIHQTQLRVSASMASHGHEDDEIVDVLLEATRAAAGKHGEFWNWQREERAIRGMIASAREKFPVRERARQPENVVSLDDAKAQREAKAEAKTTDQKKPRSIGKDAPLIARIGEAVIETWQDNRPVLGRIDGELWCYANGWWQPFDDKLQSRMKVDIQTTVRGFNANPGTSTLNAVFRYVTEHDSLDRQGSFADAAPVIVGRSTTLVVSSGSIEPHNPDHLATFAIDCEHDELALCPDWLRFLGSAFSPLEESDRVAVLSFLQEWFGIALAMPRKRELRKALLIHGQSRTGKTQILNVLEAMLGGNIASIRLSALIDSPRFGASPLYNCRGWVANDAIGSGDNLADEIFKQIITGEPCSVELKGKTAFQHSFQIPVIMSSNTLPKIKDTSDGVYNRIAVLRMSNVVPEGAEGAEEIYEGIVRNELAGVFQWALEGRRRALTRGRFVIPQVVADEVQALKTANNPAREFAATFWIPDEGYCVDRRDIWCLWCAWLEDGEGDNANERYGKQTVFRLFEGAAGCRTAQNSAGRTRYMGGRITEQATFMICDFVSRFPLEKRKHGSGAPQDSINQPLGEYVKNMKARGGEIKPSPDGKSGPKARF